nr:MAG TPA: hypothetical protein [Caudoviricetes sp.]DAP25129.1 MAG TPA: hypothetical protein [Caudoviricetes sp.]
MLYRKITSFPFVLIIFPQPLKHIFRSTIINPKRLRSIIRQSFAL